LTWSSSTTLHGSPATSWTRSQQFRELRFRGVDLYFVNQGLHSGRDNAEFLLAIYGAMDSEYIRELGRKTHRGLEGQARHGLSAGGSAFGYRREPLYDAARLDRDGQPHRAGVRWVVEPAEAETVRTIFCWYAEGRGLHVIAGLLNSRGIPSPRQAKGHRARRDGVGAGWDLSTVRVILANERYRGRLVWNRSQWVRVPGSRRRRRVARPETEWVTVEQPDLRIVDEALWARVEARRREVRARFVDRTQFGRARREYGTHLLSGRLVCAECGGLLSIRTSRPSRYGCTRHWRRGSTACGNNLLVPRDLAEARVVELLQRQFYVPAGVDQLVAAVNARLRARQPELATEQERLRQDRHRVRQRLDGVRRFVEAGDSSARVRQWLPELETEDTQVEEALRGIDAEAARPLLRVHPGKVEGYLADLRTTSRADPGPGNSYTPIWNAS
jgi:hypothetical protein